MNIDTNKYLLVYEVLMLLSSKTSIIMIRIKRGHDLPWQIHCKPSVCDGKS